MSKGWSRDSVSEFWYRIFLIVQDKIFRVCYNLSAMNSFLLSIVRFVNCRVKIFCFFFLIFAIVISIYPQSRDFPSNSSYMERIAGAFGFKFNQTFNPDNALSVVYDNSDNLPLYLVEPITPNMMFSEYFITLSPNDQQNQLYLCSVYD